MSLLRRFAPRLYMARRNLLRAKSRSALAILTIVIGVVAIAGLGAFGATFQAAQLDTVGQLGQDVQVSPGEDLDGSFDERDVREIERLSGGATVVPVAQQTVRQDGEFLTILGIGEPGKLFDAREGSIPDNWRTGALVGSSFAESHDVGPGQQVTVDGESYRVLAVLEEEGPVSILSPDNGIVVPPSSIDGDGYDQVLVQAENANEAATLADRIDDEMNDRQEIVSVFEQSEFIEQTEEIFWQINVFLVGIAAISLLVAGISIGNVMLMSAIERREEIGVLRAVGYRRLDVLGIMLSEAILLGFVGATIGLALSTLATMGVNSLLLDDPLAFQIGAVQYLAAAFVFGVGISALAGLYPAWKASRKRPVEALRG